MKKTWWLYEAMCRRHEIYNESLLFVERREKEGRVFVFRPSETLPAKRTERDPKRLQATWEAGYRLTEREQERWQAFLKNKKENC